MARIPNFFLSFFIAFKPLSESKQVLDEYPRKLDLEMCLEKLSEFSRLPYKGFKLAIKLNIIKTFAIPRDVKDDLQRFFSN